MPLLIGMDEAGYGPNLGPLVITAVAWEVADDPRQVDLWEVFDGVVAQEPATNGEHLQIADSKKVYSPARGLAALETGVLAALKLWRGRDDSVECGAPVTFRELWQLVTMQTLADGAGEQWFDGEDLSLPYAQGERSSSDGEQERLIDVWRGLCVQQKITLRAIRSEIVSPERFNAHTRLRDSKGQALSEMSMHVLGRIWQEVAAEENEHALIIADKHGGRNRYHDFLPLVFGDRFIRCRAEGLDLSCYQVGRAEIRFETKSERYLPVALASMVSKYIRELAMVLFNRFWTTRVPGLKPTAGYPGDSGRFRAAIAPLQRKLGITDDVLWRER